MKSYKYKDIHLSLLRHPSTSDIVGRYDIDAIKTALKHILLTNKGEKLFNPTFGADLRGLLFELITPSLKLLIKKKIIEEIVVWEPRVIVENVNILTTEMTGELVIILYFRVKDFPEELNTVTIKLERVR